MTPLAGAKTCACCGEVFRRRKNTASNDWKARKYCSIACSTRATAGARRRPRIDPKPAGPRTVRVPAAALPDEWKLFGSCREESNKDRWFAHPRTEADDADEAKRICGWCPVRTQCLRYALATGEPWGIWGGLDHRQRAALLERRNR